MLAPWMALCFNSSDQIYFASWLMDGGYGLTLCYILCAKLEGLRPLTAGFTSTRVPHDPAFVRRTLNHV